MEVFVFPGTVNFGNHCCKRLHSCIYTGWIRNITKWKSYCYGFITVSMVVVILPGTDLWHVSWFLHAHHLIQERNEPITIVGVTRGVWWSRSCQIQLSCPTTQQLLIYWNNFEITDIQLQWTDIYSITMFCNFIVRYVKNINIKVVYVT